MRAVMQIFVCSVLASSLGCIAADGDSLFARHVEGEVPANAILVHSGIKSIGIDTSHGFVLAVEDESLLNLLIAEWELSRSDSPSAGVFDSKEHKWWPSKEELSEIIPNYSRSDEEVEEYWIVWPDTKTGRLYVEHGWW